MPQAIVIIIRLLAHSCAQVTCRRFLQRLIGRRGYWSSWLCNHRIEPNQPRQRHPQMRLHTRRRRRRGTHSGPKLRQVLIKLLRNLTSGYAYVHFTALTILKFVLQRLVREHMNTMMGRVEEDRNQPPESVSPEAILKYNRTCDKEDGPSKDQFQADLYTKPLERSKWNNRLFDIFIGDYVLQSFPSYHKNDLRTYFMTYLRTLQKKLQSVARPEISKATAHRIRVLRRRQTVRSNLSVQYTYSDNS